MRLFVMMPAYNEGASIASVIKSIPRKIKGVDEVSVLVVNDGSKDNTVEQAKKAGANYIVTHKHNLGLSKAFQDGLNACLSLGADVIVNIDADGQHNSKEIPKVAKPVIEGWADLVLTNRNVFSLPYSPIGKKLGNWLASSVTRFISGYPVKDAQSGFRAFSRDAALKINVRNAYTYVQETIIQAADKRMRIVQTDCHCTSRRDGNSRLVSSLWSYGKRAFSIFVRSYVRYKPLKVFLSIGLLVMLPGIFFCIRFLWLWLSGSGGAHIQSLIAATILLVVGFQLIMLALLADTVDAERGISEELLYRNKKRDFAVNLEKVEPHSQVLR